MSALPTRIRKARLLARMTQAELARRVGVKRSAVTQWEHPLGTSPSMHHLIEIAEHTGTQLEWLATGRGRQRAGDLPATVPNEDYAQDQDESEALSRFRLLPVSKRRIALDILQVLSG